jgi:hypothetical protein
MSGEMMMPVDDDVEKAGRSIDWWIGKIDREIGRQIGSE